jgi:hypothetical protein
VSEQGASRTSAASVNTSDPEIAALATPARGIPRIAAQPWSARPVVGSGGDGEGPQTVATFLLWLILLFLCWPLALLALVLYPLVWLLLLPLRLVGIAVGGVLDLLRALITLPAHILSGPRRW